LNTLFGIRFIAINNYVTILEKKNRKHLLTSLTFCIVDMIIYALSIKKRFKYYVVMI